MTISGITAHQSTGAQSHEQCNKLIEELKFDKSELEKKVDGRIKENDKLKIELAEATVRLEERDKQLMEVKEQLKEWIDTANRLIKGKADFDQWKSQLQRISAANSSAQSKQLSPVCSQDGYASPLTQSDNTLLDKFTTSKRYKIDQHHFKKAFAFTYNKPMMRAKRKRSQKRIMKLSSIQEVKYACYSENLIAKQLHQIKQELSTVQDIFAPLSTMHTTTPFEFVSKLFCDGIFITDVVFDNHKEFESFFAEHDIHVYVTQRSWRTRKDKRQQDELKNQPKFIRLRDENAIIDKEFLIKLSKAMNGLRQKAYDSKVLQTIQKLQVQQLDELQLASIKDDVSKIILTKLDATKDFKGCIYSENYKFAVNQLQQLFGFTKPANNKSSQSCFQFIKGDGTRIKLYSKDLHLLQATSTTKKVSLGIKPIFVSRVFRERLSKCNETCMSRIEHSNKFTSIQEEQEFLMNGNTAVKLDGDLSAIISAINDSSLIGLVNCGIARNQLWRIFFESIKSTYIFKNKKQVAVVYAYSKEYCKYVGLFEESSLTSVELTAKFGLNECHIYDIQNTNNYSKTVKIKHSSAFQIPIIPGTYDLNCLREIGIDVDELLLKSTLNTYEVELEQIGDATQISLSVPLAEVEIHTAQQIEKQYSNHKSEIKTIDEMNQQTLIHGIRGTNGKVTLYDYNNDIKFQQSYSSKQFPFLEQLISQEQHQLIQGMYVFVNGLNQQTVLDFIQHANADHYFNLTNAIEEHENHKQAERKRKDRLRYTSQMKHQIIESNESVDELQKNHNSQSNIDNALCSEQTEHLQLGQLNDESAGQIVVNTENKVKLLQVKTKDFCDNGLVKLEDIDASTLWVKKGAHRGKQRWKCKTCNLKTTDRKMHKC